MKNKKQQVIGLARQEMRRLRLGPFCGLIASAVVIAAARGDVTKITTKVEARDYLTSISASIPLVVYPEKKPPPMARQAPAPPVVGYWRKDGKDRMLRWHVGDTETSTYCRIETDGGKYVFTDERPADHSLCEKCKREMLPKPEWQIRHETEEKEFFKTTAFLETYEWRKLRMTALTKYGAKCMCCNATREHGVRIHVDHIKPRRLFPELALTLSNLQILCEDCNHGKGNWDQTDWRPREEDQLPEGALEHMRDILKH